MVLESEVPLKAMLPFKKSDVCLSTYNSNLSSVPSTNVSATHGLPVLADAAFLILNLCEESGKLQVDVDVLKVDLCNDEEQCDVASILFLLNSKDISLEEFSQFFTYQPLEIIKGMHKKANVLCKFFFQWQQRSIMESCSGFCFGLGIRSPNKE